MNESRIISLFKEFLESKGLLEDYERLWSHGRYYSKLDDWLNAVNPQYYVRGAFIWTVSLWDQVNEEWMKLLNEYE